MTSCVLFAATGMTRMHARTHTHAHAHAHTKKLCAEAVIESAHIGRLIECAQFRCADLWLDLLHENLAHESCCETPH